MREAPLDRLIVAAPFVLRSACGGRLVPQADLEGSNERVASIRPPILYDAGNAYGNGFPSKSFFRRIHSCPTEALTVKVWGFTFLGRYGNPPRFTM